jgi:hypothetical protein
VPQHALDASPSVHPFSLNRLLSNPYNWHLQADRVFRRFGISNLQKRKRSSAKMETQICALGMVPETSQILRDPAKWRKSNNFQLNSTEFQVQSYFLRFGEDTLVLEPVELQEKFYKHHSFSQKI